MDVDKSEEKYDIYAVLGHAMSCLIASGMPVETDNLLKQLRILEQNSVDGMRKLYGEAARMVEGPTA